MTERLELSQKQWVKRRIMAILEMPMCNVRTFMHNSDSHPQYRQLLIWV